MKNIFKKIIFLFSISILLTNCGDSDDSKSNPLLYKEYVSSFTYGQISTSSPIVVRLSQNISEETKADINSLDIFDITPKVKGKVVYTANNEIQFIPNKPLEQDTQYKVSVKLSKLYKDIPKDLRKFNFEFKTLKQRFSVSLNELQSYNKDLYFLNGELKASDAIDSEKAKEILSVSLNGKGFPFKIEDSNGTRSNKIHFIIDSIPSSIEPAELSVSWDDEGNEKKEEMRIPSRDAFYPISAKVSKDNKNVVIINFSKPLYKKQNFSGLVSLEEDTNPYYTINGNILKMFLKKSVLGQQTLNIYSGIKSNYGQTLDQEYNFDLYFAAQNPEIEFVQNGTILPNSKNLKVNFKAVNLRAVDVTIYEIFPNNILQFLQENSLSSNYELKRVASPIAKKRMILDTGIESLSELNAYSIDLSNIITPNPGAIYHVELDYQKDYAITQCDGKEKQPLTPFEQYDNFEEDLSDYDDYYDYNWEERDDPCKDSYYYNKAISTNVLASNLGVIVKKGQNSEYTVIVNDINTTEPVADALVEIYSYQQQKIGEATTSGNGIAKINTPKEGYFALVTKDKNTTYVKIDNARALSVSNFEVDGTQLQKGLNGYIYTERGVWRPGDAVFVGFILDDFENKIPKGLPIKLTFKDPFGKVILQQVQISNKTNQYAFELKTDSEAPTGNWQVEIQAGAARFYKTIKIETIKPNRLKILNNIENKEIYKGKEIRWEIKWLHGLPAVDISVDASARFSRALTQFKGYKEYTFDNPFSNFDGFEYTLFSNKKTNSQGEISAIFSPEIENAPGMLNVSFLTKAHERGGDVSTDVATAKYSPYKLYTGIKAPKTNDYNYYNTGETHLFELICLTDQGKPMPNEDLNIKVFKTNWSWWWDASNQNISDYTYSTSRDVYGQATAVTDENGKASFEINISDENWGRYVLLVSSPKNNQTAAISAYFDWENWYSRPGKNSEQASMLIVNSDKESYQVKERAKIQFPSEEGGRALISVENGNKVIQTDWIVTQSGKTQYELPITQEMTPNVYVSVTLLQPHSKSINDNPIRMYGILPINVEDKNTKLQPEIQMPDVLRPEQETTIKVKEQSGKEMAYTLAIVEDGLLDLTRFKTPNAWNTFFAKTALGVKTWDIYNDVIGAYGGKINQVFSIGGDENLAGAKAQKANRFDPLVIFKGPFLLSKGSTDTHKIKLPNYIGSARVMVVASNVAKNAYGSSEKTVPVRSPLMVLGSMPRKAVPGEQITLPVTVFAIEKGIKNANVTIECNDKLQIVGTKQQSVSFSEPSEKMTYFTLKVGNTPGIAKVKITATSSGKKAEYEVELDVYNPNPRTYRQLSSVLSKGVGETLNWNVFGAKGTNEVHLEVSNFPGVNLSERMGYLMSYPHGCSEQITSIAFPQLYLNNFESLSEKQQQQTQKNVNDAIGKLFERQLPSGGFAYWSGDSDANDWVTSYVGNFMLEAEKKGFVLPANSKESWITYQQRQAKNWKYVKRYQNDITQAYRLYTLSLVNKPDMASMNRLRESSELSTQAQLLLASAYALSGQKKVASSLFNSVTLSDITESSPYTYFYYGSPTRNRAIALETALLLKDKKQAATLALKITEVLSSKKWMSTQSISFALVSMAHYVAENKSAPINVTINYNGKKETLSSSEPMLIKKLPINKGEQQLFIKNNAQGTAYVKVINSGILPVGDELAQQQGLALEVQFKDANGNSVQPDRVKQGKEFTAWISLKNLTQEAVQNIALTQLIPSGWEIVNMRYTDYGGTENKVDYTDIRDDRTNFYFSLGGNKSQTFQVILNASYLGRYYLPGAYAEAMYNHDYNSRTQGQWVEVIE